MMLRMKNERHLGNRREFFRFEGAVSSSAKSAPSSNSTVSAGIPNKGGSVRTLIDGSIFMTWIVLGAFFMWIVGKALPTFGPKSSCKDDQVFH
jgi:hypothetical protein